MARTIQQIENDIDAKLVLQIMEYVKDYMANKLNVEFGNLNTSLNNIKTYVSGISQITSQLGKPLAPAATHPTVDLNEGDWYFNTTDKKFYMYHTSAWQDIADLSHLVDTDPLQIETKNYGSWADLEADKDVIVSVGLFPKAQIDHFGAAIRQSAFIPLHPFFTQGWGLQGAADMSNNKEYKVQADANGVQLRDGTSIVGSGAASFIGWDKFSIYAQVVKGKTLNTGGTANLKYGTLAEVYDLERGSSVVDSTIKVLHVKEIAELVKDQREIDKKWLANFSDVLTYTDASHITYTDKELKLLTLKADVSTTGTTVSYSTLISPYDRIQQEQASFTGTFAVNGMAVEYLFTSKGKALKFNGNTGQTYTWETIGKFENNVRVPYLRFSGTGTMATSDDALTPAPTWTSRTLPYEIKLSDLMDENNKTALVQMNFATLPAAGTKIMDIDYLTSTYFIESRFGHFLQTIGNTNTDKFELKTFDYSSSARTISSLVQSPNRFVVIDKPVEAASTPIGTSNKILVSATVPAGVQDTDQVTYGSDLVWIVKANGDIMNWSEIKQEVADGKYMIIKLLESGNWELVKWESPMATVEYVDAELAKKQNTLTRTLTVEFTDGSTEDFLVG